ncbi:MAG: hypothetical protein GF331_02465 [Chitinivibrionales bacterium]|nr:hypothetical protein [Chitinivibrionales bacterium]
MWKCICALDVPEELRAKLLDLSSPDIGSSSEAPRGPSNIDNSIDEDNYFIGAGDVFRISVPEMPSIVYHAEVNQNCDVVVSDLGVLELGKRSLAEAKEALKEFVEPRIRRGGDVYVALSRGKNATVAVSGAVENPGTYSMSGMLRVLDAIRKANNGELPKQSDHDYRAVIVSNGDLSDTVDLFAYMYASADTANPYLYPGDHILLKETTQIVHLSGAVRVPFDGAVPLRRGETALELLSLMPLMASADSTRISVLTGRTQGERTRRMMTLQECRDYVLQDNDQIMVLPKKDYAEATYSHVRGEVLSPAAVPITEGVTTAREAIELCGGATSQADLSRAVVVRHSKMVARSLKEGPASLAQRLPGNFDLSVVRPEVGAAFHKMNLINDYAIVSLSDDSGECPLLSGDHVIVPPREHFVYVSGNVGAPGAYPYVEGESHRHYVKEAGGFTGKADRSNTFVLAQYAGAVVMKTNRDVQAGDIIVVPDAQETKFLRTLFLPVLQAVATTVAAVVALISVAQ